MKKYNIINCLYMPDKLSIFRHTRVSMVAEMSSERARLPPLTCSSASSRTWQPLVTSGGIPSQTYVLWSADSGQSWRRCGIGERVLPQERLSCTDAGRGLLRIGRPSGHSAQCCRSDGYECVILTLGHRAPGFTWHRAARGPWSSRTRAGSR
jgi:hypothetical protein